MSVNDRHRQTGAAMVEMAIVLSLFLALVFGIMEFAMAYFTWHRAAEGARDGLRYAIVSGSATGGSLSMTCPDDPAIEVSPCNGSCLPVLQQVQRVAPFVEEDQVTVTYACSDAGNPDRPGDIPIPKVTVQISGLTYTFIVPGIIGIGTTLNLPDITVSRTGEDLFTTSGS